MPACVLFPHSEQEVTGLIRAARAEGVALRPRGGGWSYTAAHAPQSENSAVVDMKNVGGIAVDSERGTLTAGAGVTWAVLDDALKAQGLCASSFGPLAGIGAQIGATAAQDGGFFGAAGHGPVGQNSIAAVT